MTTIFIAGSGSWGTALAISLASAGNHIKLWSRNPDTTEELRSTRENKKYLPGITIPENVEFTSDISECADFEIIVIATPSHTVRLVSRSMSEFVKDGQIIVSVSKGFGQEKHLRLTEVIKEEIPVANVLVMSGPSHAEEVSRLLPTTNVVAGEDLAITKFVQKAFNTPSFRIYRSDDVIGVELGGALKNVIAVAAGVCDGIGYGDNTKAALITRGIVEITRLGVAMGAKFETFSGLSGIGDLIVTCASMHSRNRRAGILIGQGKSVRDAESEISMVIEGLKAAKSVHYLSEKYGVEMPISNAVYGVVFEGCDVNESISDLMSRKLKPEI